MSQTQYCSARLLLYREMIKTAVGDDDSGGELPGGEFKWVSDGLNFCQ
ncbi:hypothetical protein [Novipirellula rosea]|uniref:Uncharacterized protein n=1 Tax=Novipirellula rosea TaxID=1031540 RepID=A0ABP8NBF8_9BACT